MYTAITKSHSLRAGILAALFVVGNLVLPQIAHLVGGAGPVWLPIYFFTIIATCTCGLTTGLLTGILSVVLNHALFGMPTAAMLPVILAKSVVLCVVITMMLKIINKRNIKLLPAFCASVSAIGISAVLGMSIEALMSDLTVAIDSLRVALPGLTMQAMVLTTLVLRNR